MTKRKDSKQVVKKILSSYRDPQDDKEFCAKMDKITKTNNSTNKDKGEYDWLDKLLRTMAIETCLADRQAQLAIRPDTIKNANVSFNHAILRCMHQIIVRFESEQL